MLYLGVMEDRRCCDATSLGSNQYNTVIKKIEKKTKN